MHRHLRIAAVLTLGLALAGAGFAADTRLSLDPEASEATFYLEATGHDVEGHLYLRSGQLDIDPAGHLVSGEIVLDATRSESGNKKRDKTMHQKVLESSAFPAIVFRPERFTGDLAAEGESNVQVEGTVTILGHEHPLTLDARLELHGDTFDAATTFPVPYVEWGLHDPSVFMLKVAKEVQVTISATGTVETDAADMASAAETH